MTRIPPGIRRSKRASRGVRNVTLGIRSLESHAGTCGRHGTCHGCGDLFPGNIGEDARRAFDSPGTPRERPYAFPDPTRCHRERWKELLLLQWPTKRSNFAAVTRRSTE